MALPTTIDATRPTGNDSVNDPASTIDNQIRADKQAFVDLMGCPVHPTSLTAAWFSITAAGIVSLAQPATQRIVGVLDRTATDALANDNTEKTLYTFSLPGNVLGTASKVRLVLSGINATTQATTIRCKYGGTTLVTLTRTPISADGLVRVEFELMGDAATNIQLGYGILYGGGVTDTFAIFDGDRGTAAVDSTVAQTLLVTGQLVVAAGSITVQHALLEYYP